MVCGGGRSRVAALRGLPEQLTGYRIGDPDGLYPVFSPDGASRAPGRWHERGDRVIYVAGHYSTAMLEVLLRWRHTLPPNQHYVEVEIPTGVNYEVVTAELLPDWHTRGGNAARQFGHRWYAELRSAILFVPSMVARMERNVIINASHPDFRRIKPGLETPVLWDERLFE